VTRHGQPVLKGVCAADRQYPRGDRILSALGRRQAAWLGEHLARVGFKGQLFSSPYRRTLETAQIIAEVTQRSVTPEPALQEIGHPDRPSDGRKLTPGEMAECYPAVDPHASLPSPWRINTPETDEQIQTRVGAFLKRLVVMDLAEALLIAHGATVHACIRLLVPDGVPESEAEVVPVNWNCALTTLRVDDQADASLIRLFDIAHMPPECVTSNSVRYARPDGDAR